MGGSGPDKMVILANYSGDRRGLCAVTGDGVYVSGGNNRPHYRDPGKSVGSVVIGDRETV